MEHLKYILKTNLSARILEVAVCEVVSLWQLFKPKSQVIYSGQKTFWQ